MNFSTDGGGFAFSCDDLKLSIDASTWATRLAHDHPPHEKGIGVVLLVGGGDFGGYLLALSARRAGGLGLD
jgi:hypothetical protein